MKQYFSIRSHIRIVASFCAEFKSDKVSLWRKGLQMSKVIPNPDTETEENIILGALERL